VNPRFLSVSLLTATCLAGAARADFITGRVIDTLGNPVPGVNIDADNLGSGGDPTLFNDGTDASGFFNTTIPNGLYDLYFIPPLPPTTTLQTRILTNVVVVGTLDLGDVVLQPGISIAGRCVRSGSIPVAGVNLDVYQNGVKLYTPGDTSDAFGNFLIPSPPGPIELRLLTAGVVGVTLAPRSFQLDLSVNTNLGDVQLFPGFHLTGTVRRTNGTAIAGANIDLVDSTTNESVFVQGNDTGVTGVFDVIVAAGVYDVQICAPTGQLLVDQELANQNVSGATNLGIITMPAGVVLSGTITRAAGGQPVGGVDLDITNTSNGASIFSCNDNTNASGVYSVVVPNGNYSIFYSPPLTQALAGVTHVVNVAGTTTHDVALPNCSFGNNYGVGLAGTGGFVPHLFGASTAPRSVNNAWGWQVTNGVGGGIGSLIVSRAQITINLFGGQLLVHPGPAFSERLTVVLGGAPGQPGAGSKFVPMPVPIAGLLGIDFYCQIGLFDLGAPQNISLSEGYHVVFCP